MFVMNKEEMKKFWKKFWFVVWKDDSIRGWFMSVLFIFIVVKFVFFPLLSLITGTVLPLAIVESCSMYHDGNLISNFDNWWEKHEYKYDDYEISKEGFDNYLFTGGFNKGDILFIVRANSEKLKVGDVIIFNGGRQNPIIHRIIEIKEQDGKKVFSTMGDNNNGQLNVEKEIYEEQLIGKAVFNIAPYVGWIKLIFYEGQRSAAERGFCEEN